MIQIDREYITNVVMCKHCGRKFSNKDQKTVIRLIRLHDLKTHKIIRSTCINIPINDANDDDMRDISINKLSTEYHSLVAC